MDRIGNCNQNSATNMIEFHLKMEGTHGLARKLHFCPMGICVNKDEPDSLTEHQ